MEKNKLIQYIFIISIFLITCKKPEPCNNQDTNYFYDVPDSIRAIIPYKWNDTLVFKNDSNEIDTLFGVKYSESYVTERTAFNNSMDCPKTWYSNYQKLTYTFKSNKDQSLNDLTYYVKVDQREAVPKFILIAYSINYNNKYVEGSFQYLYYKVLNSKLFDDSIQLNNIFYKGFYLNDDNDTKFLYGLEKGVLKFTDDLNIKWVKIK